MSSIDDLRTNKDYTGTGVASGNTDGIMKLGSIIEKLRHKRIHRGRNI